MTKRKVIKKNKKEYFHKYFSDGELWVRGPIYRKRAEWNDNIYLQIRHGFWRFYHKNNKVAHCGRYIHGSHFGRWKEYDERGKKIGEKIYID